MISSAPVTIPDVATGDVLCRTLESLGATHIFALPGTQTVPLFEALRRSQLATVVPTHELAASMMAAAYHRVCGKPGLLLTIPGPGFTYALTGLAEARLDSAALIHFVPAVAEGPDARYSLQAIPQTTLASALAKVVLHAGDAAELRQVTQRAYEISMSGEPGPVVVFLGSRANNEATRSCVTVPGNAGHATRACDLVRSAQRPVILAGQGCLGSADALQAFAEGCNLPIVTTASARGVVPEDHPLAMGFDAHRGTSAAVNELFDASDLVIVLGAKLGHNGTAGHALRFLEGRTVRVDTDASVLESQGNPASLAVQMPVAEFLALNSANPRTPAHWTTTELAIRKLAIRTPVATPPEPLLAGQQASEFFAQLRKAVPRNATFVTDTGLHQVMARRYLEVYAPGGLLIPTDFQSMGFGLPAAIAAKLAAPNRPVVLLIGDGGLAMCGMELATAAKHSLSIPVIVFDDGQLNQIRLHQQAEFGTDFGVTLPHLNFRALATSTGAEYSDIESNLPDLLRDAFGQRTPTLLRLPVGDSQPMRRRKSVARVKFLARRTLGESLATRLRTLKGR